MQLKEITSNLSTLDRDYVTLEFENICAFTDEILKLRSAIPNIDKETIYLKEVTEEYEETKSDLSDISSKRLMSYQEFFSSQR